MNSAVTSSAVAGPDIADNATTMSQKPVSDIAAFLAAMATTLGETVARFEETVARITEIAVQHSGRPGRDLVIALQNFDRLQQEFVAISEVLAKVAATAADRSSIEAGALLCSREAIASISIGALKERLERHLRFSATGFADPATLDEVVF